MTYEHFHTGEVVGSIPTATKRPIAVCRQSRERLLNTNRFYGAKETRVDVVCADTEFGWKHDCNGGQCGCPSCSRSVFLAGSRESGGCILGATWRPQHVSPRVSFLTWGVRCRAKNRSQAISINLSWLKPQRKPWRAPRHCPRLFEGFPGSAEDYYRARS